MTIARDDLEGGAGVDQGSSPLLGREAERARLAQLLTDVAAGRSAALCLYGQRGIGKSALLEDAVGRAGTFRVLRVRGLATERDLPYAGLHQLCTPLMNELHRLEPRQLAALSAAFGETTEQPPDRLLVSLAMLNLLNQIAAVRPVCCVVDDAHLLDAASLLVLAFVARRAEGSPRLVLFAEDEQSRRTELEGLPETQLGPMASDDARTALSTMAPQGIDPAVIERVLLEARGNAQALADAFAGITAAELAGGFAIPAPRPDDRTQDHRSAQRILHLPDSARTLLLVAASEPTGNPTVVWRAAVLLGIEIEAAEALEAEDLLTFGPRVLFNHPQFRAAVYAAANRAERQSVHRALAEATNVADVDRRTWHLALSISGFDERIAGDLERHAPAAQARGGAAAHGAFLEKAALLSADPESRAQRSLVAAAAKQMAGDMDAALRLLAIAEIAAPDKPLEARITLQRARIAFTARRDHSAPGQLLDAAERLAPHWPILARQAHLEALVASMATGRFGGSPTTTEIARTARAVAARESDQMVDLLLQALATRVLDGYVAAVPLLRRAVDAFGPGIGSPVAEGWRWLAGFIAADLWDERAWNRVSGEREGTSFGERSEAEPDFQRPDHAFAQASLADLYHGHFERAQAILVEADAHIQGVGVAPVLSPSVLLAAWQGKADILKERLPVARRHARHRGDDRGLAAVSLAEAVLYNGLGYYDKAIVAVQHAAESDQLVLAGWALPELVEAATRSGQYEKAAAALDHLRARAQATDTDWGLGLYAVSAAHLAESRVAEELYREAIDQLSRTEMRLHLGRAHLVYGEWLRRQNRRVAAREELRSAMELFVTIGADAFAGRARSELLATGERARARRPGTARKLTPQEHRIAYLACDGLTNPEIGSELFISPRTVEYHLGNVFGKLAISSRTELHLVLERTAPPSRQVLPWAVRPS